MICMTCCGEGWVWPGNLYEGDPEPCPDCDGCGLAYCCEGERAQPEDENAAQPGPQVLQ